MYLVRHCEEGWCSTVPNLSNLTLCAFTQYNVSDTDTPESIFQLLSHKISPRSWLDAVQKGFTHLETLKEYFIHNCGWECQVSLSPRGDVLGIRVEPVKGDVTKAYEKLFVLADRYDARSITLIPKIKELFEFCVVHDSRNSKEGKSALDLEVGQLESIARALRMLELYQDEDTFAFAEFAALLGCRRLTKEMVLSTPKESLLSAIGNGYVKLLLQLINEALLRRRSEAVVVGDDLRRQRFSGLRLDPDSLRVDITAAPSDSNTISALGFQFNPFPEYDHALRSSTNGYMFDVVNKFVLPTKKKGKEMQGVLDFVNHIVVSKFDPASSALVPVTWNPKALVEIPAGHPLSLLTLEDGNKFRGLISLETLLSFNRSDEIIDQEADLNRNLQVIAAQEQTKIVECVLACENGAGCNDDWNAVEVVVANSDAYSSFFPNNQEWRDTLVSLCESILTNPTCFDTQSAQKVNDEIRHNPQFLIGALLAPSTSELKHWWSVVLKGFAVILRDHVVPQDIVMMSNVVYLVLFGEMMRNSDDPRRYLPAALPLRFIVNVSPPQIVFNRVGSSLLYLSTSHPDVDVLASIFLLLKFFVTWIEAAISHNQSQHTSSRTGNRVVVLNEVDRHVESFGRVSPHLKQYFDVSASCGHLVEPHRILLSRLG